MKLDKLFSLDRTVLSFEVFPPKKTSGIETIYNALNDLAALSPDFISVTYGAGGGDNNSMTVKIAAYIEKTLKIPSAAHLTCLYNSKADISETLDKFRENGIENILALRGDFIPGAEQKADFGYASDMIGFIKREGDFHVLGACYPEGHVEAESIDDDIKNLRYKVEAGADHLITQLFFDNALFYGFREKLESEGIEAFIEAGIMPVVNKSQIERMVSLCGASIPPKFAKMMQKYEHNPEALREAGIAYAVDQIIDLISNGVKGIHLYTMNNPYVARKITESIKSLL